MYVHRFLCAICQTLKEKCAVTGPGGYSHIWVIWVCAAQQGMLFAFLLFPVVFHKKGHFHYVIGHVTYIIDRVLHFCNLFNQYINQLFIKQLS